MRPLLAPLLVLAVLLPGCAAPTERTDGPDVPAVSTSSMVYSECRFSYAFLLTPRDQADIELPEGFTFGESEPIARIEARMYECGLVQVGDENLTDVREALVAFQVQPPPEMEGPADAHFLLVGIGTTSETAAETYRRWNVTQDGAGEGTLADGTPARTFGQGATPTGKGAWSFEFSTVRDPPLRPVTYSSHDRFFAIGADGALAAFDVEAQFNALETGRTVMEKHTGILRSGSPASGAGGISPGSTYVVTQVRLT